MIAILGDLNLDFPTHRELVAEVERLGADFTIEWVPTDSPTAKERVCAAGGLWVIPGTPYQDDDVVYRAIHYARENNQPFLGSCGGFQYAAVEFARNVAGIEFAAHAETDPNAKEQVVAALSCSLIAEEREVTAIAGTLLGKICGTQPFTGYHYCNYGLSERYEQALSESGLVINSRAMDAGVEGFELADHRFFVATLFQPQVGALAAKAQHPLISAFLSAATHS